MPSGSAPSGARGLRARLLLSLAGGLALVAAYAVGIADNPVGLALVYTGVTTLLVAWVHPWRSLRRFLLLFVVSLLTFPVAVVLHNLFYALAGLVAASGALAKALGFLEGFFLIVAVLIAPPGAVVGALGAGWMAMQRYREGR